ncbi:hypothetical protein F5X99DRAFT_127404 [Biscogniauxia marginata]|nr:hypothetical protein F5X99DRAFT_127404 [Biscogniauxia marginata]
MACINDPLGILSPPDDGDYTLPKTNSDTINPSETPPLPSWDTIDPGDYPVKSITPIDPAIQGLTKSTVNFVSLVDDSLVSPNLTKHQVVDRLAPPAMQTANASLDAEGDVPVDHQVKRRDSRRSSSSDDSQTRTGRPRKRQLEKSRLAANKCRQKKKKENANLEAQSRLLEDQQIKLKAAADVLQSEVLILKNEILKHGLCSDCEPIQRYIAESANRLVCRR